MAEKYEFKAEVKELLHLVVNSLYSNRDIFLRELISNASDAIDKARYLSITNPELKIDTTNWEIMITFEPEKNILIISDNGIGMNKDDIKENLGTIAKSGTKEFVEMVKKAQNAGDIGLIGQFGVGFYSAFMVADKIEVVTKKVGEEGGVKWTSKADGTYEIEDTKKDKSGTDIILHLKDDCREYLDGMKIKNIVKKYSDYIEYPIVLVTKEKDKDKKEILNSMKAIWLRDKSEIKEEEYKEFYKHISHDFNDPLDYIHYKAEGTIEFSALLYIPEKRPINIYYKDFKYGPALYVKKVQIMESCEELIPIYLRFIKGVVDSSDLPLNVSREMLQSNRVIFQINKNIAKKVLDKLNELKKNEFEKYEKFYNEFGNILKEGIYVDFEKKEEIAKLLIFNSLKHLDKKIDFSTYVENMKEDQKEIFYMTGSSINEMINSPHLEYFKEKDIDVIFLTDEIDEIVMSALMEFNLKKVKSILKGDIEVDEETKKRQSENEREHKTLLAKIKEELKDYVKDVKAGARLKNSLCCLVYDENEMDDTTRRLFEAMGQTVPESKMILELNLEHPVVRKLNELYKIDPKSPKISEYAKIIYDLALVEEGKKPIDSPSFAKKVAELLEKDI